jgi:hypothetical protein
MSNRIHIRALKHVASEPGKATEPKKTTVQEELMGIVMIRCPATGREISTGIQIDRPQFESTPVFFAQTYCPFCRAEHRWFAKDAWVREPGAATAA